MVTLIDEWRRKFPSCMVVKRLRVKHDSDRFKSVSLTGQITVIGIKLVYKHQDLQTLRLKSHNFHPLEIVGRDSETQLQVCKKFNDFFSASSQGRIQKKIGSGSNLQFRPYIYIYIHI